MAFSYEKYKGIHPGTILERELKKRKIKQRPFALSIQVHPQTFNAILKGKRGLNVSAALKIEQELDLEEGALVMLQAFYDIELEKQKQIQAKSVNISMLDHLKPSLFWDTEFTKIDWIKQYKPVIKRVFDKGNSKDQNQIIQFYGEQTVQRVLSESNSSNSYTLYQNNAPNSDRNTTSSEYTSEDNE